MPRFDINEESCARGESYPRYEATDWFERMEEAVWESDYAAMREARWALRDLGWIVDRRPTRAEVEAEREPDEPDPWRLLRLWDFVAVENFSEADLRMLFARPDAPAPAAIDAFGPLWYSFEVDLFLRIVEKGQ